MVSVNKKMTLFCTLIIFICNSKTFAISDAELCSKEALLSEECHYTNAEQKRDCLTVQVKKIKTCEQKVAALDQQLVKVAMEKGLATIDSLKIEKAVVLQKLKEFERILERHNADMKFTSVGFVRFVKTFTNEYRASEAQIQSKLQKIVQSASECQNHLDLINIRFSAENFLREEQTKGRQIGQSASEFNVEFQEKANSLWERLKEYSPFIDKNTLKASIPNYEQERDLAQGLEKYAVLRLSKVEDSVSKLIHQINAKIVVLQKKKLEEDKKRDFKLSNDIAKETEFHKYVVKLIDDAFLKTERSKFQKFEFYGARFKGMQKFMTLGSLCSSESLSQARNDWLVWGCERYEEYLPKAKKKLESLYAKNIKRTLTDISWDKPDLQESSEILTALSQGNLERAIEMYDQLLISLEKMLVTP